MRCACTSASALNCDEDAFGAEDNEGISLGPRCPSMFCRADLLPAWQEEFAVEPPFHLQIRRDVAAFGLALPVPHDPWTSRNCATVTGTGVPGSYRGGSKAGRRGVLALRRGVPDSWKAAAWLEASGAVSFQTRLRSEGGGTLRRWYEQNLVFTFGTTSAPKVFADGHEGRPPMFDQGVSRDEQSCFGACGRIRTPANFGKHFPQTLQNSSREDTLETLWPHIVVALTASGVSAAKRVLWVLNKLWQDRAPFCPWVVPLVLALLLFCEEHETCAILHCLINRAVDTPAESRTKPASRAFLFLDRIGLQRAVSQFVSHGQSLGGGTGSALARLKELGVDVHALAACWLQDCLASMLPIRAFLRIIGGVLSEGWKVPARYLLAFFAHADRAISDCKSAEDAWQGPLRFEGVSSLVRRGGKEFDALTVMAFKLKIRSRNHPFWAPGADNCTTPYLANAEKRELCWPRLKPGDNCSKLVNEAVLVTLWSEALPVLTRLKQQHLVFATYRDGYNLRSLTERCQHVSNAAYMEVPMLFLFATDCCGVLGGYAPLLWKSTGGSFIDRCAGFEQAFVFVASQCHQRADSSCRDQVSDEIPSELKRKETNKVEETPTRTTAPVSLYTWTGANELLFNLSRDGMLFGGDLPAIALDAELLTGSTSACATFGSPPLTVPLEGSVSGGGVNAETSAIISSMPKKHVLQDRTVNFRATAVEVWAFVDDN